MITSHVNPIYHLRDFCTCLPIIGIGCLLGTMIVIESTASKILNKRGLESDSDIPPCFQEKDPPEYIKKLFTEFKIGCLLNYGKASCLGGIQGVTTLISIVALAILGLAPIGAAVAVGLLCSGMIALAVCQTIRINKFIEEELSPKAGHNPS